MSGQFEFGLGLWDRGAVDLDVLGRIKAAKDPTGAARDWQSAVAGKLR